MPSDACWACKDRKVRCDRAHPRCSRCVQADRPCQYGLRLSWPKHNDRKRAMKVTRSGNPARERYPGNIRWVNAGTWDIHLHHYISSSLQTQGQSLAHHTLLHDLSVPKVPSILNPYHLNARQMDLFEYFCAKVFGSMGKFGKDAERFYGLLHRLALSDTSLSSRAVREAVLALSSLHRQGLESTEAAQLKISALRTLSVSSMSGMGVTEGLQHVVAGMMLCYFEIQEIHQTTFQWMLYVCGAKNLMQILQLRKQSFSSEYSVIFDWVDYHFVVGLFTFRHWRHACPPNLLTKRESSYSVKHVECMRRSVVDIYDSSHDMLALLYDVVNTIKRPTDQGYFSDEYSASLTNLESRIESVPVASQDLALIERDGASSQTELYKISLLIYLERVSKNFSGQSPKIKTLAERGFELLGQFETFNAPLPLFILGLEARTEEQRMLILEVIERSTDMTYLRSLETVNYMLQAAWVQDDLETENDVDYVMKMDTIITAHRIIPILA